MRMTGLEPAPRSPLDPKSGASASSAISARKNKKTKTIGLNNRERAGIRTPDNLIKSQVLYHLSYTPVKWASWIRTSECKSKSVPTEPAMTHYLKNQHRHAPWHIPAPGQSLNLWHPVICQILSYPAGRLL